MVNNGKRLYIDSLVETNQPIYTNDRTSERIYKMKKQNMTYKDCGYLRNYISHIYSISRNILKF